MSCRMLLYRILPRPAGAFIVPVADGHGNNKESVEGDSTHRCSCRKERSSQQQKCSLSALSSVREQSINVCCLWHAVSLRVWIQWIYQSSASSKQVPPESASSSTVASLLTFRERKFALLQVIEKGCFKETLKETLCQISTFSCKESSSLPKESRVRQHALVR